MAMMIVSLRQLPIVYTLVRLFARADEKTGALLFQVVANRL
jgi:hypothetical protein